MPTHEQRVQAAISVVETLKHLGHEDLLEVIRVEWNHRFTRRLGDAQYLNTSDFPEEEAVSKYPEYFARGETILAVVRFSVPLWERATPDERRECVVHEVCHIVDRHEASLADRPLGKPHGVLWQRLMRRCGLNPERCHRIDRAGIRRTQKRYPATCGCREIGLSGRRVARMRKGIVYRCTKCGGAIILLSEVPQPARLAE